jgi:alpha-galactosidase
LPRPDGKAPDQAKKVKVFILMGQSNMVGMGDIKPVTKPGTLTYLTKTEKKYPFLVGDDGEWTVRKDVYYYDAREKHGAPLGATANNGKSIGPELGFGHVMGQLLDEPVLILKSCIGNRSLGWDLLPPGSERYEAEVTDRRGQKVTKVFAGYKDAPDSWDMDKAKGLATEPPPWIDKKTGKVIAWYAGKQYDDDMANAKAALADLPRILPGYKGQGYEIAGFVWWQGHKDHLNAAHASRYEQNLARLIPSLRKDYNALNAKFVLATGCGNPGRTGLGLQVAEAQLAIGDAKKHPEFAGNVKAVDSRDLWREANVSPANQGYHYNRNAETFMEVGLRLGWAMAELLQNKRELGNEAIPDGEMVMSQLHAIPFLAALARSQGARIGAWEFKRLCPSPVGTGTDWGELSRKKGGNRSVHLTGDPTP